MSPRTNPWLWAATGAIAVLLAAPTAAFMLVNLVPPQLEWLTGVRMPLGVVVVPELAWILPGLPLAALVVALAPALRVSISRPDDGGVALAVRIAALPRPALVVVLLCLLLVTGVAAYGISENLLELGAGG